MKKTALLLLLPVLLLGCRDQNGASDSGTDTTSTATASTDTTSAEANSTDTASTAQTSTVSDALSDLNPKDELASAESVKPGPVPAGYTRVAELSKTQVREFKAEPKRVIEDGKDYAAVIDTNKGQIVVDLFEDVPTTVNNFVFLARNNYYDGIVFHRVLDDFMAQTGDPTGTGTGGPGYSFADEFRTKYTFAEKGLLAMANSGPNTNGSQFFITFVPTEYLNGRHTIFGKVVQGQDVLDKIQRVNPEQPDPNVKPDRMVDVYIVTKNS